MKRGDVVLALFPNSDLITVKPRPALVVQRDSLQSGLPQVLLAAITSRMDRAGHSSRVTMLVLSPAGKTAGLVVDSVVLTDNIVTVNISAVSRIIGSLPMMDIDAALRYTLNL